MLAITTPFICNLEGFCTYSGSLTQLYVGAATQEAFSPSAGKESGAGNVIQNSSSWSRPRIFSFGKTMVSASSLWSVPVTDPWLQPEADGSEPPSSAPSQSCLYTVQGNWKVIKLSQEPSNSQNHNCFHTHAFVQSLTQSSVGFGFCFLFFMFNPWIKWKRLWKVWRISIIGKQSPWCWAIWISWSIFVYFIWTGFGKQSSSTWVSESKTYWNHFKKSVFYKHRV